MKNCYNGQYSVIVHSNVSEEDTSAGLGLGGLVSFADTKSDPYMLKQDEEDDKSDEEDFKIKPTDNLLLVGHVEGNASILEVYGELNCCTIIFEN